MLIPQYVFIVIRTGNISLEQGKNTTFRIKFSIKIKLG